MPKIRAHTVQAHKALLRSQILDAFEELLAEETFEQISIAAVAARAGIARNTIYNYAQDKGELLAAAAQRRVGRLLGPMQEVAARFTDPAHRLRAMLETALGTFTATPASPRLFQELMTHGRPQDIDHAASGSQEMLPMLVACLEEGAAAGQFRAIDNPTLTLDLLAAVLVTTVESVLERPETAAATIEAGLDFAMAALRA